MKTENKTTVKKQSIQTQKGVDALSAILGYSKTHIDSLSAAYGRALSGERSAVLMDASDLIHQLAVIQDAVQTPVGFTLFIQDDDNTFETIASLPALRSCVQLYAHDVQSLADLTVIAQRTAEQALVPVVVVFNGTYTGNAHQSFTAISEKMTNRFIGAANDQIPSPTMAQEIQFGKERRRLPEMISMENPIGNHVRFGQGMETQKAQAARHYFRDSHVAELLEASCMAFALLSGRDYRLPVPNKSTRNMIFAYGPNIPELETLSIAANRQFKLNNQIINLSILNPFPAKKIAHLLASIKSALVLSPSPAEHSPLLFDALNNVRQKMIENSLSGSAQGTFSEFGTFKSNRSFPTLQNILVPDGKLSPEEASTFFGILNGSGTAPLFSGLDFGKDLSRFPLLDSLQRKLHKAYPALKINLKKTGQNLDTADGKSTIKIQWLATRAHDLDVFGAWLLPLFSKPGNNHSTYLENRRNAYMPYQRFTMISSVLKKANPFAPVDAMLAIDSRYLNDLEMLDNNALLCVASSFKEFNFWQKLTPKNQKIIREKNIRIIVIDVAKLTESIPVAPAQRNALQMSALLGAYCASKSNNKSSQYNERFEAALALKTDINQNMIKELKTVFTNSMNSGSIINWPDFPEFSPLEQKVPETPWAYQNVTVHDDTIYDAARFYDTVGYLYREEQSEKVSADPFMASSTMPAASSSIRDLSPTHTYIPHLLAENCSGCGICWTQCPESALPSTLQQPRVLLEQAMALASEKGIIFMQMGRVSGHLAKTADKLLKNAVNGDFRSVENLFRGAFEQLLPKLKPDAGTEEILKNEFEALIVHLQNFPVIKSAHFENQILSITVNPNACKGCGLCIESCPDNALERSEVTGELIDDYKKRFALMTGLPTLSADSLDKFVKNEADEAFRMIGRQSYFTMTGGDNSSSGSGIKSALHQTLSAVDSAQQQRHAKLIAEIESLENKLQEAIQGKLNRSVQINSFDDFHQRLNSLDVSAKGAEVLKQLNANPQKELDATRLKYLAKLVQTLKDQKTRLSNGRSGNGAAAMSLIFQSGKILDWMSAYPYNPFNVPWVESSASEIMRTAQGVFRALASQTAQLAALLRQATESLSNTQITAAPALRWNNLTETEKGYCPSVVVILDTDSLSRQSLGSFGEILASDEPILLGALNVSGRTDAMGQPALWALSQKSSPVLQASPANPGHLIKGVRKIVQQNVPGFIHLDASDPYLHGIGEDQAYRHELRAIDTRRFPLFSYDPLKSRFFTECFELSANPSVEENWHSVVLHEGITVPPKRIDYRLTPADWALYDSRFSAEFQNIPAGRNNDAWLPMADYLELDAQQQAEKNPYVMLNLSGKLHRFSVTKRVVDFCEAQRQTWLTLQELAGMRGAGMAYMHQQAQSHLEQELANQKAALENEYNQTLATVQNEQSRQYEKRLTEKLKALYNARRNDNKANTLNV